MPTRPKDEIDQHSAEHRPGDESAEHGEQKIPSTIYTLILSGVEVLVNLGSWQVADFLADQGFKTSSLVCRWLSLWSLFVYFGLLVYPHYRFGKTIAGGCIVVGIILGIFIYAVSHYSDLPPASGLGGQFWVPASVIAIIVIALAWSLRPEVVRRKPLAPIKFPDELADRFKELRQSFEMLSGRSKGLHHVLAEQKRGAGKLESQDSGVPPGLVYQGIGTQMIAFRSPPGSPPCPRKLNETESAAVAPGQPDNKYIRDKHGRALAIWEPMTIRTSYFHGDHDVLQSFSDVAEAAAIALSMIPEEFRLRLPDSIRDLCDEQKTTLRRYVFGTVSPNEVVPEAFMAKGWMTAVLPLENGAVVDTPEPVLGGDRRSEVWTLLLHRLGWIAKATSTLRANRWNWKGGASIAYCYKGKLPDFIHVEKVSDIDDIDTDRFYSALGSSIESATDVCRASVWAINDLLKMLTSPTSAQPQPPPQTRPARGS